MKLSYGTIRVIVGALTLAFVARPLAAQSDSPADIVLGILGGQIDQASEDLKKDGFLADSDFEKWLANPKVAIDSAAATMRPYYEMNDETMPVNATAPLSARLTDLRNEALRVAPSYSFPSGLVADPAINSVVVAMFAKNVPGSKVLKVGMEGKEWGINRDDFGLVESRYRYGYALYQMPGERFARCSTITYRENFDGKNYQKSDFVGFRATRWQLAK